MEPLEQALEVVERVVAHVCEKLGSDAEDYINHDHVFVRAEHELQNGLDMAGAIDSIGSSLMWDVQQKLEDKIIRVKKIREELVRDSRHVMNENTGKNWKIPVQEVQQSVDVEAVSRSIANGEVGRPKSSTNVNDCTWGSNSPVLPTSPEPDDDDIRVLTPVPRSPAPLIVLTDDSLDASGPSTPSVSVVKEEPEVNEVRTQHMNETASQNAEENTDVAGTDIVMLNKEEVSVIDAGNKEEGDILNNNNSNSIVRNPVEMKENVEAIDLHNGDAAFDYSVGGIVNRQKEENPEKEKEVQQKVEVNGAAVPALKNGEEKDKGDLINFLSNNPVDYENPYDALWEEAYYVCSVLPFFELAQVHQSLMDRFYHSDRRACVLEEYYKLALNQDEDVPDVVFHGLLAARKRSYADVDDAELAVGGKKMKSNSSADHKQAAAIGMQYLDNSQPSTSGGNYSLNQAPVVADMSIAKSYNNIPYSNNLMEGDLVKVDKAREHWCKEKLEFVRAVVYGVHENVLREQIELCFTDDDIQRLVERLLREQEEGGSGVAQGPVERGNPVSAAQAVLPAPSAFNVVDTKNKGAPFAGPSQAASGDGATPCSSGGAEAEDPADLEDRIAAQVATLSEMFSDADPDYLQER